MKNDEAGSAVRRPDAHFEKFKHVETNVHIRKTRVKQFKFDVVHIFSDQARNFRRRVANDVQQCNNIGATCEVLENLDLTLDFLFLDGLEDLDDAFLVTENVDPFEDLAREARSASQIIEEKLAPRTSEYFPRPTFLTIS